MRSFIIYNIFVHNIYIFTKCFITGKKEKVNLILNQHFYIFLKNFQNKHVNHFFIDDGKLFVELPV